MDYLGLLITLYRRIVYDFKNDNGFVETETADSFHCIL